jgi:DNA polymerase-1
MCYWDVRERAEAVFKTKSFAGLEADDVMGILATKPSDKRRIICSADKDMKTLPATIWNGKDLETYSVLQADMFHMYQTLIGDTADGYKGCPGIGPVKAEKLLAEATNEGVQYMWPAVVAAYESKGLTEADALLQARLARILRHSDWDGEKKQPILWTPH